MIGQLLVPTLAERKESLDLTKGVVFLFLIGFYGSYILFSFFRDMKTFILKKKIQVLYIQETWPPLKKGKPTIYPTIV